MQLPLLPALSSPVPSTPNPGSPRRWVGWRLRGTDEFHVFVLTDSPAEPRAALASYLEDHREHEALAGRQVWDYELIVL